MRIVLSGGGTAGHINPALALAEELKDRGHDVYFAGTPNGVESSLVQIAGLPFKGFEASGFDRSHPLSLIKGVRKLSKSAQKAGLWFSELMPSAVVVFGGYACLPVGRAAKAFNIPLVVHEQNSVMGMANDYLSKDAKAVALTYESAGQTVKNKAKLIVTGNPVRKSVIEATREEGRAYLGIPEDAVMLLVFGGSLGARHINTAFTEMKDELLAIDNLYVVHVTGPKEYPDVVKQMNLTEEQQKRYIIKDYEERMGDVMAAADCIVSRAGASSLAEISARCIPAILVPFPYATADHQTANAKEYVERGAAWLVPDNEVESPSFAAQVLELVQDEQVRQKMKEAAATFETHNAASRLADVVELVAKPRAWQEEEDEEDEEDYEEEDADQAEDEEDEDDASESDEGAADKVDEAETASGAEEPSSDDKADDPKEDVRDR